MTALRRRIVDLIEALGPIPVGEYMAMCLLDPRDGYYTTRDPFGAAGDFVTAPEISQMFGELIGVWIAGAWEALGRPAEPVVTEIGPGRGTLMKDIARTLSRIAPELRWAGRFWLVEASQKLGWAQATTLEGSGGRFDWAKSVEELPDGPLIVVANELFDAIPLRQYVKTAEGWRERLVALGDGDELVFAAGPGRPDDTLLPAHAATAPDCAIVELAPARLALMQTLAARLASTGGAGLFIDYGYEGPAVGDTLQALRRHKPEDVFANPGEADLTAHVDFAPLTAAAKAAGLDTMFATQGDFLIAMGLLERAGRLGSDASDTQREDISAAVQRLAGYDEMGNLFKVLSVGPRGVRLPPAA